ncbi:dihydrodipicolinate synthase family protein [Paraburkholderia aromaticivorans]|uniref:Dihydrodipicolinate synthase family protein n=1 Tax=Paraburkholderia aromaticivorans TaxID=2026199 RepID=A0A248VPF3_9BURK|nr:dihydrodipicolinate synthase family protein [Paraburkholderia aromaticivorans]ASW00928.1 dihydrodipicolinate synthase family protein [Paraburkholderia aromaticivorans]
MQVNWKGVFPAVTTKLKDDGSLDHEAIKSGLNRLIANGVGGVVMMGMVGENAQLTAHEKRTVLKLAVETVAGRVPVISGLAETNTALAVQFARDAEAIGVQGLMVFPGLTYRSDDRETVEFYRTIARSTKLGLMIYNNPRGYGVDMRPDLLEQLKDEANVVAIKEETYDTTRVTDLLKRFGDRFVVFCGVDDLVLESAALGVTGWVSGMANAMPKESVELLNLAVAGDFAKARKLYRALIDLFHLDVHVKLVQYIKLAENITAGYPENVKAPRLKLEGEERQRVVAIVEQAIANVRALSE